MQEWHSCPQHLLHRADIPPAQRPLSWVIRKLAVAEELALQRWAADGCVGSRCTWYHGDLLTLDQLQSIWPWLSPCEQGCALQEECGPLDRASALRPGAFTCAKVHNAKMAWSPSIKSFSFKLLAVANESNLLPHQCWWALALLY